MGRQDGLQEDQTLQAGATQFPALKPSYYVFPSERYHLKGTTGIYDGKADVYNMLPEKLIKSFARAWRTAKPTAGVDAIAGHLSVNMKELYSHTRAEAKRAAVALFDKPLEPLPQSTIVDWIL